MEQQPAPSTQTPQPTKMSGRTKLALWLLIAPTGLLLGTFFIFALVNWVFAAIAPDSAGSVLNSVINILLFLAGTLGTITWLPGLITGIILLATKK